MEPNSTLLSYTHDYDPRQKKYIEEVSPKAREYVEARIKKAKPTIVVFDEGSWGGDLLKKAFENKEYIGDENTNYGGATLGRMLSAIKNSLVGLDYNPTIWTSMQTPPGRRSPEASADPISFHTQFSMGITKKNGQELYVSRSPTSKRNRGRSARGSLTEDELYQIERFGEEYEKPTGRVVKHPEQRKRALAYVKELKQIGIEAGQELHAELERKQSLEQKVTSVIAIAGFLGSLIFLQSNVTGNAIADLSTNTTSWVGGVLLAVGLVAGFFWIKKKKKKASSRKK